MNHSMLLRTLLLLLCSVVFFKTAFCQNGMDFYNQGLELQEAKRYAEAVDVFTRGIEFKDLAVAANYLGRSNAYLELQEFEKAKQDVKSGLRTEKVNSDYLNGSLYIILASVYGQEGRSEDEFAEYSKAVSYLPNDYRLKINISLTLIKLGRPKEAKSLLDSILTAISTDEFAPYAFNNRAHASILLGKLDSAKRDLDHSLSLDPENPFVYKNYFLYYQAVGKADEACSQLAIALSKNMAEYGYPNDAKKLKALHEKHCDGEPEELPAIGFQAPYYYDVLEDEDKAAMADLTDDFCIIKHPDQTDRFIRAVLSIPIKGTGETFDYGLWVSVSEKSYKAYKKTYNKDGKTQTYFGRISNEIADYETSTLALHADIVTRNGGIRPEIVLHKSDHPLFTDWTNGITREEALRRIRLLEGR